MLDSLRGSLRGAVGRIVKSQGVDADLIKALKKDVQRALLLSDVDAALTVEITGRLEKRALEETPPPGPVPEEPRGHHTV